MSKKIWKDCLKEPAPLGKKVLCQNNGDFYVAQRFEEYYIPIPFPDHYNATHLSKPETWCEIDFPEPYTGYVRVQIPGHGDKKFTLDELKLIDEKSYYELAESMIKFIGKIPKPKGYP